MASFSIVFISCLHFSGNFWGIPSRLSLRLMSIFFFRGFIVAFCFCHISYRFWTICWDPFLLFGRCFTSLLDYKRNLTRSLCALSLQTQPRERINRVRKKTSIPCGPLATSMHNHGPFAAASLARGCVRCVVSVYWLDGINKSWDLTWFWRFLVWRGWKPTLLERNFENDAWEGFALGAKITLPTDHLPSTGGCR